MSHGHAIMAGRRPVYAPVMFDSFGVQVPRQQGRRNVTREKCRSVNLARRDRQWSSVPLSPRLILRRFQARAASATRVEIGGIINDFGDTVFSRVFTRMHPILRFGYSGVTPKTIRGSQGTSASSASPVPIPSGATLDAINAALLASLDARLAGCGPEDLSGSVKVSLS
jgi:hypothetical protein